MMAKWFQRENSYLLKYVYPYGWALSSAKFSISYKTRSFLTKFKVEMSFWCDTKIWSCQERLLVGTVPRITHTGRRECHEFLIRKLLDLHFKKTCVLIVANKQINCSKKTQTSRDVLISVWDIFPKNNELVKIHKFNFFLTELSASDTNSPKK